MQRGRAVARRDDVGHAKPLRNGLLEARHQWPLRDPAGANRFCRRLSLFFAKVWLCDWDERRSSRLCRPC